MRAVDEVKKVNVIVVRKEDRLLVAAAVEDVIVAARNILHGAHCSVGVNRLAKG
jgi:hypothetical protein